MALSGFYPAKLKLSQTLTNEWKEGSDVMKERTGLHILTFFYFFVNTTRCSIIEYCGEKKACQLATDVMLYLFNGRQQEKWITTWTQRIYNHFIFFVSIVFIIFCIVVEL